jgi:hypothetical protein
MPPRNMYRSGDQQRYARGSSGRHKKHLTGGDAAGTEQRAAGNSKDGDEDRCRPGKIEERLSQQDAGDEGKSEEDDGTVHG